MSSYQEEAEREMWEAAAAPAPTPTPQIPPLEGSTPLGVRPAPSPIPPEPEAEPVPPAPLVLEQMTLDTTP